MSIEDNVLTMTVRQVNGLVLDSFRIVGETDEVDPPNDPSTDQGGTSANPSVENDTESDSSESTPVDSQPSQSSKSGCKSAIHAVLPVAMLVAGGSGLLFKKKKTKKGNKEGEYL